ncbi:glycine betaine ABC transporter substrate-binding protein [Anoxynatronum sibiricum]|uniref:Glycine betaine ABC transporter substrate-binding protein n=1 Tax=Anoxynatronum sibiricum TaxID=210623 RepID=A0ABU9VSY7_9CLOT
MKKRSCTMRESKPEDGQRDHHRQSHSPNHSHHPVHRPGFRGVFLLLTLLVTAVLLAGCGSREANKVVIASKPMPEQYVLAEMLGLLIEAETDIEVELNHGIGGGTSNIHPAMERGDIDIYPEYTGTGWLFVLKEDLIADPQTLYQATKEAYAAAYQIHWTGLYGFENTYGIAVTREVAAAHQLHSITDLVAVSPTLTFATNADFFEREDGYPGLQEVYGLAFGSLKEIDIGLRYDVVRNNQTDALAVFTTDGQLQEVDVVVLEDDRHFFPAYHAATLVRMETLDKYPELEAVLEKLTGQITNEDMIAMNYAVEVENKDPREVAENFLREKGLLP